MTTSRMQESVFNVIEDYQFQIVLSRSILKSDLAGVSLQNYKEMLCSKTKEEHEIFSNQNSLEKEEKF